jgi:hypothetical protein
VPSSYNTFVSENFLAIVGTGASRKAKWIDPANRIRRVLIDVDPARQPDGILRYEPFIIRVIVPAPVISKPVYFPRNLL